MSAMTIALVAAIAYIVLQNGFRIDMRAESYGSCRAWGCH
jgi:hypothetical protein